MIIYLLKNYPNYTIVNIDKMDTCSSLWNINKRNSPNYHFVKGNILNADLVTHLIEKYKIDSVLHFAASSHVGDSFESSVKFTKNNVLGTHVLLECCRKSSIARIVFTSTDEVYGTMAYETPCGETFDFNFTNPYAASKASAENIVRTYLKCYKLPVITTRSNNIFGPRQFFNKIIPKFICRLKQGLSCQIEGDGTARRSFIYIKDAVKAFDIVLHKGVVGEVYNIEADQEVSVLQAAKMIISMFKFEDWQRHIEMVPDRLQNDKRYLIDGSKLRKLGYESSTSFEDGLTKTYLWYMKNDVQTIWDCIV